MGTSESGPRPASDPSREKRRVEAQCPGLRGMPYRVTSESTKTYNCFAWAAGDFRRYWSPVPESGYYWPPDLPRDAGFMRLAFTTVEVIEEYFTRCGFDRCDSPAKESGVAKVAIFGDDVGALHVARQEPGGMWLSKMGDGPDIEHEELEWVEGPMMGKLQLILCKEVPRAEPLFFPGGEG